MGFGWSDIKKLQERGLVVNGATDQEIFRKSAEEDIPLGKLYIERCFDEKNIPFEKEKRVVEGRQFRYDYYFEWNSKKYAVEYEGIFAEKKEGKNNTGKSGHTTVQGYIKDCVKYNLGVLSGVFILRYSAANYKDFGKHLDFIVDGK